MKKKTCFIEDDLDDEGMLLVKLLEFDDDGKRSIVHRKMSVEDVYMEIDKFAESTGFNDLSDLSILQRSMGQVCPVSILDFSYIEWIDIQQMCETYNVLPFPGSLLEQPKKAFEIMATIMESKSLYEADYYEQLKSKSGGGG